MPTVLTVVASLLLLYYMLAFYTYLYLRMHMPTFFYAYIHTLSYVSIDKL